MMRCGCCWKLQPGHKAKGLQKLYSPTPFSGGLANGAQSRSDSSSQFVQPAAKTQVQSTALTLRQFPLLLLLTFHVFRYIHVTARRSRHSTGLSRSFTEWSRAAFLFGRSVCPSLIRNHTHQAEDTLFIFSYTETSNNYPEEFTES